MHNAYGDRKTPRQSKLRRLGGNEFPGPNYIPPNKVSTLAVGWSAVLNIYIYPTIQNNL